MKTRTLKDYKFTIEAAKGLGWKHMHTNSRGYLMGLSPEGVHGLVPRLLVLMKKKKKKD